MYKERSREIVTKVTEAISSLTPKRGGKREVMVLPWKRNDRMNIPLSRRTENLKKEIEEAKEKVRIRNFNSVQLIYFINKHGIDALASVLEEDLDQGKNRLNYYNFHAFTDAQRRRINPEIPLRQLIQGMKENGKDSGWKQD